MRPDLQARLLRVSKVISKLAAKGPRDLVNDILSMVTKKPGAYTPEWMINVFVQQHSGTHPYGLSVDKIKEVIQQIVQKGSIVVGDKGLLYPAGQKTAAGSK